MPEMPPSPEGGKPSASASQMVAEIFSKMSMLQELMGDSPAVGDDDRQALGSAMQAFQGFVEGLSSAPGQKPQAPAPQGAAPMEAGAADVKPAM